MSTTCPVCGKFVHVQKDWAVEGRVRIVCTDRKGLDTHFLFVGPIDFLEKMLEIRK